MDFALFTCADTIGQSQFNAWGSWKRIPDCSVSVFGNAPGVGDHAKRFGFRSIPAVKRDNFGRPLLNSIFERMHNESAASVLGYVNSDIILLPGLATSLAAVRAQFDAYLIVARRWNVESLPALDFAPGWDEKLRNVVAREGELFTPYGIDLFVFSRGLLREIPPFGLGSDYWDNYLVMLTRRRGYPVIDVTEQVMLVHQNHSFGKYRSAAERRRGPEGLRAFALAGDSHALLGQTTDATHVVAHGELRCAETAHVTAVLPHSGEPRRLCRCLRALEYQTYPQSFLNAIVVNTDPEAPLRYLEADFPSLRVVTEPWSGPAAARKKGISCATAEVVALFDSDIVPETDCLERAMRMMAEQPESQVVVCRIIPIFSSGPMSYIARAVEWFDAVTQYGRSDGTEAGPFDTRAVMVRKEVFARCGYFTELGRDAASADREWAERVIAAGVKVAFCRDATVRHETVRSIAELRREQQRSARGDCILESLERGDAYGVVDIIRDEWFAFRARSTSFRKSTTIPRRYRAGALLVSLWSLIWTVRAKLQYRNEALRVVRRRRQAPGTLRAQLPFRWLLARGTSRRIRTRMPRIALLAMDRRTTEEPDHVPDV
jgi:glycosyltransferase involved in cell wall biosynthesis